jgi:RNA polymerase sigma-70 factor (ECF subfamily)
MSEIINRTQPTINSSGTLDVVPGISAQGREIDVLLLRILNDNDYQAFHQLFAKMYNPLCQFCVKFVHVREVAEELVSDVFYTIWKNRARIEVTSPRSYLFTAVRNRGFDHLRKMKKVMLCNLEEATHIATQCSNSQEVMVETELSKTIEQSISTLPKQCRLIFELSREHGLKYREIASQLKISIKTVETQMGRALKHLRQTLPPM